MPVANHEKPATHAAGGGLGQGGSGHGSGGGRGGGRGGGPGGPHTVSALTAHAHFITSPPVHAAQVSQGVVPVIDHVTPEMQGSGSSSDPVTGSSGSGGSGSPLALHTVLLFTVQAHVRISLSGHVLRQPWHGALPVGDHVMPTTHDASGGGGGSGGGSLVLALHDVSALI